MPNYMDDLFKKIKDKKTATGTEKREPEIPEEKKEDAKTVPKIQEARPIQKPVQPAPKPFAQTKKIVAEPIPKKEEFAIPPMEKKSEPIKQEPLFKKPVPKPEPQKSIEKEKKKGFLFFGKKEKPKPAQETHLEEAPEEKPKIVSAFAKAQKPIEEPKELTEKDIEEVNKKIEEIRKELPPQDKTPLTQEQKNEQEKSLAEKVVEKKGKELIDEYGDAKIYKIPGEALLYYFSPVPRPVGAEKTIINTIKEAAARIVSITPYRIRDPEQRRNVYYQQVLEILRNSPEMNIPKTRYEFYADAVVREMVGYGIIDFLIKDDFLEEIMIIGPKIPVYVFHRKYEMMLTNIEFYNDNEIQDLVNRIARQVGRRVDLSSPLLDARLPDGSRVNATIPPASVVGSTLTIRKFRADPYTIVDLINYGTMDAESAAFLWVAVEGMGTRPANIIIAGGTGSGKTTTLNVLASFIPETDRIISIEDTAELNLPLKHWIRMEARPPGLEGTGELTLDILTKNSLRMRPDRIIVGEIRHDEAFSLFTAFNTGHDGSLGTVHANSAEETLVRVTSPPMNVPKLMLSGLNFVLVQHRLHDRKNGTIRRVTEIAEVTDVLEGKAKTQAVYKRDAKTDSLKRTKAQIKYLEMLADMTGISIKQVEEEIQRRAQFLSKLAKEKTRDMITVSQKMNEFLNK